MTPRTRNRVLLGLALGLVVSAILLWLAARNADLSEVRSVLAQADIGFVALALASLAVFYAGQALRWSAIAGLHEFLSCGSGKWW